MKYIFIASVLFLTGAILSSCTPGPQAKQETGINSGIEYRNMDPTVRPQDNFYRFMNGNWLRETEIPADRARWGSFDELREKSEQHVLEIILKSAASDTDWGTNTQKIGDLYRSYMNEKLLNELGISPLEPQIELITSIKSHEELPKVWGYLQRYRFGIPFSVGVGQDQMQSDQYITAASQSGIGLPDRDYYLVDSESNQKIKQAYEEMILRFWELAGWADTDIAVSDIMAIETKIAQSQWSRVQNRDRNATYNKIPKAELSVRFPGIDWVSFLEHAELGDIEEIIIRQPSYFADVAAFHTEFPVDSWKNYLKFHLVRSSAGMLSTDFNEASFDFYGRVLSGQQEQRSREKRGVSTVESVLGFMVGKEYVDSHYPKEASERMDEMIGNLMTAFDEAIKGLEWMGEETKIEALAKLGTFTTKIGYPRVWRDYDCVEIMADDLMGNMRRNAICEYERNVSRLGQEIDIEEWGMTPQTVNAYYRATMNEIVFPAAILQPPFFDFTADDAVNYGAIGAVIGHEISHGFDDQGRRSDGDGNLRDWWTPQDEEQFQARAQQMIDQYSAFNPIDNLYLQGALGLGENIADLGGMTVAYRAYINSLGGKEPPVINGFTGQQRFFMGWGQIWRIQFRDESLRQQVITGPHSPGKYRVLGVLSNMPEFYEAFDIQPGDGMYREENVRVKIW